MSLSGPTPGIAPAIPDDLPDDPATLKSMVRELLASLQQKDQDLQATRHRLDLLLRRLYGPRNERHTPNQPLLFDQPPAGAEPEPSAPALADNSEPDEAAAKRKKRRCRPHGRRRLPEHLPRQPEHHLLSEAQRLCPQCGQLRLDIGTDQSEQLDYRPASLVVIEHFVHKYACPCCSPVAASAAADQEVGSAAAGHEASGSVAVAAAAFLQPSHAATTPSLPALVPPATTATLPADERATQRSDLDLQLPQPTGLPVEPSTVGIAAVLPQPTGLPVEPSTVVIAAVKPAMPIAKGLPAAGLLAHLIVSKYVDHLPLYRLEHIYERDGLVLARSTLCDWLAACAALLQPLYLRLVEEVLRSRVLHTDDTQVKLRDPVGQQLSTARLWGYLGDAAHPYNVFDFTTTRRRDGPQQFLATYQGYLQADAFSGYDCLYLPDPKTATALILEVACNAHARRKFFEARTSDELGAHRALAYYRQLYELERRATENDFDEWQRLQLRQELAVPILEQFHAWLEGERARVVPKSPLAAAIGYALNNWTALVRYTDAGFLAIDNNVAEREMKQIAIGRKNWLFVGSAQGGQTAAVLMSFTSTCKRLGVEPWAYLRAVLQRLPTLPPEELDQLLPDRWQALRSASTAAAAATLQG